MSSEAFASGGIEEDRSRSRRRSLQRFVSKLIRPTASKKDRSSIGGLPSPSTRARQDTSSAPVTTVPLVTSGDVVGSTGDTNVQSQPTATRTSAVEQQRHTPVSADPIIPTVHVPTAGNANIRDVERTKPQDSASNTSYIISSKPIAKSRVIYANLSYQDRARLIAEKHGVEMSEVTFPDRQPGQRVEKAIRVRIHRFCHKCNSDLGPDRVCLQCQHKYCKNCTRTPLKSEKKAKKSPRDQDLYAGLTKPGKKGGQDLIHKPIRQRVHHRCHKCNTDFGSTKECRSCGHMLCTTCPREPSKKPKKIHDEANLSESHATKERTYKKTQRKVSYVCSECQTTFTESRTCSKCGHERCSNCTRIPLQKDKSKAVERPISSSTAERRDTFNEPLSTLARPTSQDIIQGTATAQTLPPQPPSTQSTSSPPNTVEPASIIDQLRRRFSLTKIK